MAAFLCIAPSCKVIVRDGTKRCTKHTKAVKKHKVEARKFTGRRNSKIYDSAAWRRLSKKKKVIMPFCESCYNNKHEVVGDVCDHILEIEDYPKLAYLMDNLMTLCHNCHNEKTADVAGARKRNTINIWYERYINDNDLVELNQYIN